MTQVRCGPSLKACGDGIDNDVDGRIDAADPECTGPCDDDEATFGTRVSNGACPLDVYFDSDFGTGNDDCRWDLRCDALTPVISCPYNPSQTVGTGTCAGVAQSTTCQAWLPQVPNGCDCFGCCSVPDGGSVYLGTGGASPTCTTVDLAADAFCKPCTQAASCRNTCDACEVCFGSASLDAGCGGQQECGSAERCGADNGFSCPVGKYCITGCCIDAPT